MTECVRGPATSNPPVWQRASLPPPLSTDEVHVWKVLASEESAGRVGCLLSRDEQERASRYFHEQNRNRFITARGFLRTILARYLDLTPESLEFVLGVSGKPELSAHSYGRLNFNVSHSGQYALIAVAQFDSVGVDIERVNCELDMLELASRYFSRPEADFLKSLAPKDLPIEFFRCWVRKEAYLKGLGIGMTHALNRFAVSGPPARGRRRVWPCHPELATLSAWFVEDLDPIPEYVGAVAVPSSQFRLQLLQYNWGSRQ